MKDKVSAAFSRIPFLGFRKNLREDMERLHPGQNVERLLEDYYKRKCRLCVLVAVIGILFGVGLHIVETRESLLRGNSIFRRESKNAESEKVVLQVEGIKSHGKEQIEIEVLPMLLSAEETEVSFREFLEALPVLILGENSDLQHVFRDLELQHQYEGYPFWVNWESSRPDVADSNGWVAELTSAVNLILQCEIVYGDFAENWSTEISVVPPILSEERKDLLALTETVAELEKESRDQKVWELPRDWEGEELYWSEKRTDYSLLIWLFTPALVLMISLAMDKDFQEEVTRRQARMKAEYPELIHKLSIYVGAGLSVRNALERISFAYEKEQAADKNAGVNKPGTEAVSLICKRMRAGLPEVEAYRQLGKNTGVREYLRLGALLTQNLKRGNSQLLERLREEAERISEDALLERRKLGEEAGTKLLVPMVMLLAMVMIMIMIPAFAGI